MASEPREIQVWTVRGAWVSEPFYNFTEAKMVMYADHIAKVAEMQAKIERLKENGRETQAKVTRFALDVLSLDTENAALREQLVRLQWRPITPEDLPKVGDDHSAKKGGIEFNCVQRLNESGLLEMVIIESSVGISASLADCAVIWTHPEFTRYNSRWIWCPIAPPEAK